MNNDTTCNGWSNYATWRVNLEIIDDYVSSLEGGYAPFADVYELADHFKDVADDVVSSYGELEGLAVDYARAFLSQVNWDEIAASQATGDDAWLIAGEEEDDA